MHATTVQSLVIVTALGVWLAPPLNYHFTHVFGFFLTFANFGAYVQLKLICEIKRKLALILAAPSATTVESLLLVIRHWSILFCRFKEKDGSKCSNSKAQIIFCLLLIYL